MGGGRLREVVAHGGSTDHCILARWVLSRFLGTFRFVLFLFLF